MTEVLVVVVVVMLIDVRRSSYNSEMNKVKTNPKLPRCQMMSYKLLNMPVQLMRPPYVDANYVKKT